MHRVPAARVYTSPSAGERAVPPVPVKVLPSARAGPVLVPVKAPPAVLAALAVEPALPPVPVKAPPVVLAP
eukprot:6322059-Alexandrium_andersonii.AAC.1